MKTCLHHIKFESHTPLMAAWTSALKQADIPLPDPGYDLWTIVPGSPDRIRRRGWDVAQVLFENWQPFPSDRHHILLSRTRNTTPLFELSPTERMRELEGAFCMASNTEVKGKHILVADDIFTLGTTVSACAKILMAAGARQVSGFALCYPLA
jgi:predicted amidophosphoribosyltransferase